MGFLSQSGYVGLRSYGGGDTFPADFGTAGIILPTRSGTLGPNRDLLVPDPEIGGNRDTQDAYLGAVSWSGDIEMYLRMKHAATVIGAAFGTIAAPTGTATTGGFLHSITGGDTLRSLAIEEQIGNGFERFRYTDAFANTFHMESEANGYLMATLGLIARKQTAGVTATAGVPVDNSPMAVGTNISVQLGGTTLGAKSFSMDLSNNVEDDDFRLGSFFLGEITPKRRELTFGTTIRPTSSAQWRQAVYGGSGLTAPGGTSTKQSLVITISSYEDMPGVTGPAGKYSITVTVPNVIIEPFAAEPSGDDVIDHDLTLRAVRPAAGTALATIVVKTDAATVA